MSTSVRDPLLELAPPYPDHSDLTVYRGDDGQLHPIRTPEDWAIRRRHIVLGFQQTAGLLPDMNHCPPLDMQIIDTAQREGFKRLRIRIVAEENDVGSPHDRLSAFLYMPDNLKPGEKRPAAVVLHGTNFCGKDIVDGLVPRYGTRGMGKELAARGYVVIAPDYPPYGELNGYDFAKDRYVSGTMKGIVNHMRCVELLQSLPQVDPQKIAALGHSLGGHNTIFLGLMDQRVKVMVSSCGWDPFHYYFGGDLKNWTSDRYMPRIREVYDCNPDKMPWDFYEVVAALAPRAFYSSSPINDSNFVWRGVQVAETKIRKIYELHGVSQEFVVRYPECGHEIPITTKRDFFQFMDRHFDHTPTRDEPPAE